MVLLPKTHKEFADPAYWKKFFEKSEAPFEWYGDYTQLSFLLDKHLKPADDVLQIGCGNSLLAEQLYDNGYRRIRSIDTDPKVISRQQLRNREKRPELVFECKSASHTEIPSSSVNVVLDKGTFDALYPSDPTPENEQLVEEILDEISRVLTPLGRYVVVTLAQEHILRKLISYFMKSKQFLFRMQKSESTDSDFMMPVFGVIVTKLKMPLPREPPIEFLRNDDSKPERVSSVDELLALIDAEREFNWFSHRTATKLEEESTIRICDSAGVPRYELTLVDDPQATNLNSYGIFVVPLGRETEWIFSTAKGRAMLRQQCGKHRLAVVRLFREQKYDSLTLIQTELNGTVLRFKPKTVSGKIQYFSLGDVDVTETIATGASDFNGKWAVEQVRIEEKTYRRLVFLSNYNLVQSEVEVKKSSKRQWRIANDVLSCDHHKKMLTAVHWLGGVHEARKRPLRFAVLGLGGGLLVHFLLEKFPKCQVTAVELDPAVVEVAKKYFWLPHASDRLRVVVGDALDFVENTAKNESDRFDVIFTDLAGAMHEDGLSGPPAVFVSDKVLHLTKRCLKAEGVWTLNLVTRDDEAGDRVKKSIADVFPVNYSNRGEEDVNEVLISPLNNGNRAKDEFAAEKDDAWLKSYAEDLKNLRLLPRT